MEFEKLIEAIRLIEGRIITPIIYMSETDFKIEFICLCETASDEDLFETGERLSVILNKPTEVVDIFEYDTSDRIDIVQNADLVYSDDPMIEQMLALGLAEEYRQAQTEKKHMLQRKTECGTYYLQ